LLFFRIDDPLAGFVDNLIGVYLGPPTCVADQIRHDASGMHRESTDALTLADRVQRDGDQGVSRFRPPLTDPRVVLTVLEIVPNALH
jgi:hypothetical protein